MGEKIHSYFYNRKKKHEMKLILKKVKKRFRKLTGVFIFNVKVALDFTPEVNGHFGGQTAPIIKNNEYKKSKIMVYGETEINEATMAHEFMHSVRQSRVENYKIKKAESIRKKTIRTKTFLPYLLEYPIHEAAAELFEIVYKTNMTTSLEADLLAYIYRINGNENCSFCTNMPELVESFMKTFNTKDKWADDPIAYINRFANIEDTGSYCIIWIYGIFIAYLLLKYRSFNTKKTLRDLAIRKNQYIVKKLKKIDTKDKLLQDFVHGQD